jgi:four helix bundle protein
VNTYDNLIAWQACHKLVLAVYLVTARWPVEERYGLVAQARRAAFSSAANLAEGSTKRSYRDFRRYIDNALASLAELRYILRLANELEFLEVKEADSLEAVRNEAGKVTWGLYRKISNEVRRRASDVSGPASPSSPPAASRLEPRR